jgi:hypothetical protein
MVCGKKLAAFLAASGLLTGPQWPMAANKQAQIPCFSAAISLPVYRSGTA